MMRTYFFLVFCFFTIISKAQQATDSTRTTQLAEVVVKAFEQNRQLKNVPAAINYVGQQALERFSPGSIVAAVNTTPGVRMEERSPGSYRFNIRGSSLRSPFGVRNVKIYYNNIPFTDPGGHTYLNNLGYYNINSIEIIKGPGSSLYGAGTGGVLLIESLNENSTNTTTAENTIGSYNTHNAYAAITTGKEGNKSKIGFQHQQSDGYRNHSALRRDVLSWSGHYRLSNKQVLKTSFLYSDLYYQTPGALKLQEFEQNAQQARPGSAFAPGAEAAKAAIYQKTFLAGISFTQQLSTNFNNTTSLYGAFTQLKNPAIRNYGTNTEPHTGGRTNFSYTKNWLASTLQLNAGGELQQNFGSIYAYKNNQGKADTLQSYDEAHTQQLFAFMQASFQTHNWTFLASASTNYLKIDFQRFAPTLLPRQIRNFKNQIAPRIALLKKLNNVTLYGSVSKGFSPPTTAELLPSGSNINLGLNAEEGRNYEIGFRGNFLKTLYIDVNAFTFNLNNTIVQRRDALGGDYYTNSGKTKQQGIETYVSYPLLQHMIFTNRSLLWLSYTWHNFNYKRFKQLDTDFSGNQLPGVAPHTLAAGFDYVATNGLGASITYYFSDKLPLNDANTAYADAYHLLGFKAGYEKFVGSKNLLKLFVGVDNLLNQQYSLGNDVNGFDGRYYNAAPGRNYYATLAWQWKAK